jgi:diaminohydroxyphosphoribosylaminopyrimidine deaminase / 5-amino-6-(5-phosphoribosylamino)uracil reductase
MQRCLQLAINGQGTVAPNPMVGSVIVHKNVIIGEGWHKAFGKAHAEINALDAVKDKTLLGESTLFVNLEPCSHFGKTPPCADEIIRRGIPKVVIGLQDPYLVVNGSGIQKLKNAGIEVVVNVLEKECRDLNKRFLTFHSQKRPYIILKWAQSADGFIGCIGEKINISNAYSQKLVHRWRSEEAGIIAGTGTILNDNPHLNVRLWKGNNPVRITIDREQRLTDDLHFFDGSQKSIVFTYNPPSVKKNNCEYIKITKGNNELNEIMQLLYEKNIQSVLVEGGALLLQSFIEMNLWDEARVFSSAVNLHSGVVAPFLKTAVHHHEILLNDRLEFYYHS